MTIIHLLMNTWPVIPYQLLTSYPPLLCFPEASPVDNTDNESEDQGITFTVSKDRKDSSDNGRYLYQTTFVSIQLRCEI